MRPRNAPADALAREQRALVVSASGSAVLGVVGIVWGVLASAGVLVFDGVYTLAGILLSAVSLVASRAVAHAPDTEFPFGRHAATPLAVAVQGTALAATLVYGAVDAVTTILDGGSDADQSTLVAYGLVSGVASVALAVLIGRLAPGSELADAEVVSWRAGAVLAAVVLVGGLAGLALVRAGHADVAAYTDPVLVLIAVALLARLPVDLLRSAAHELLEGAAPAPIRAVVDDAVREVREQFGLPSPLVRATKLGNRLYVEVDFVVEAHRWEIDDEDDVRRAVTDRIADELPFESWVTVELTTDRALAE